jgi:aldose 1-epimerase
MAFKIVKRKEHGLELIALMDDEAGTEAVVLPAFGALLNGFSITTGNQTFNVIDNYESGEAAASGISKTYKSARLSPFPCRLPEGKYVYEGKAYELRKKFLDGSAIHGLLFDKPFVQEEEKSGPDMVSVRLRYDYRQDDDQYPFEYTCWVEYTLRPGSVLEIRSTVRNNGEGTIPMADGWHPYFKLGGKIDDWILYFNSDAMLEFDDKLIPTGKLKAQKLFKEPRKIGDLFMDNCYLLNPVNGKPSCELINPQNRIHVTFFPDSSYPYLQIYTPSHRQSIAIENLSAAPDCFNNKMGLLLLKPQHSQTFTVQYKLALQ